jgi:hypothetical protein
VPTFRVPFEGKDEFPPFMRLLSILEILNDVSALHRRLACHLTLDFSEVGILATNLDLNTTARVCGNANGSLGKKTPLCQLPIAPANSSILNLLLKENNHLLAVRPKAGERRCSDCADLPAFRRVRIDCRFESFWVKLAAKEAVFLG